MRIQRMLATMLVIGFSVSAVHAGSPVYVGSKTAGKISMDDIDHSPWDALLKKRVDKNGLVNYRAIKGSRAELLALDNYLKHLSTANVREKCTREAKLAFWINAYNAVTVHGILREYPTTSIRNHTAKLGYNVWKDLKLFVGGQPYSLDDMEHKVLRKMNEPRIHFAVVCASIGCPRLLNSAYMPKKVNEQLDLNAKDFFSRPQNFRHRGSEFQLSSILDWYGKDFGATSTTQLKRISEWLPTDAARRAAATGRGKISFLEYSWKLNQQ